MKKTTLFVFSTTLAILLGVMSSTCFANSGAAVLSKSNPSPESTILWRYLTERMIGMSNRHLVKVASIGMQLDTNEVKKHFTRSLDMLRFVDNGLAFLVMSDDSEAALHAYLRILHLSTGSGYDDALHALRTLRAINSNAVDFVISFFSEQLGKVSESYDRTPPPLKLLSKRVDDIIEHTAEGIPYPVQLLQKKHNVDYELAQKVTLAITTQEQISLIFKDYVKGKISYEELFTSIESKIEASKELFEAWELAGLEDALVMFEVL